MNAIKVARVAMGLLASLALVTQTLVTSSLDRFNTFLVSTQPATVHVAGSPYAITASAATGTRSRRATTRSPTSTATWW